MLLEKLIEKANRKPEYDWDAYYQWLFSEDAGHEVDGFTFWECRKCLDDKPALSAGSLREVPLLLAYLYCIITVLTMELT